MVTEDIAPFKTVFTKPTSLFRFYILSNYNNADCKGKDKARKEAR